jgi:histidine phosphotransferase ChpT
MAQQADSLRLVELVCARLCHDLGGLIGTVGNAIDMVAEDSERENEVLAFAASAAKALTQRLRMLRAAWGPEAGPITLPELVRLVTPALAARRIGLDARAFPPDGVFSPPIGRVVLNLIALAGDCLPSGGAIVVMGVPDDLLIRIAGPGAAWPSGLVTCLSGEAAALAALTGVRSVQMALTALLALNGNLRLSPVLGPGSGVEALRLLPAEQNV